MYRFTPATGSLDTRATYVLPFIAYLYCGLLYASAAAASSSERLPLAGNDCITCAVVVSLSSDAQKTGKEADSVVGFVVRLVVSALVLLFVGFLVPGFRIFGFLNALIAAAAIAVLGFLVETLMGRRISPQSRGIVGFIVAAVVIYAAQFVVPTLEVSIFGALLASFVIGIIDAVVPTELR